MSKASAKRGSTMTRERRAAAAAVLKDEGRTYQEIADLLGVSPATAKGYIWDPDGTKHTEARVAAMKPCTNCGKPTSSKKTGLCIVCGGIAKRKWTKENILASIKRWADEHDGNRPLATDWLKGTGGEWPNLHAIQREFGSFSNAIAEAGYEPFTPKTASLEELLDQLRAASTNGIAPPSTAPEVKTLAPKFAKRELTWDAACELAGVKSRNSLRRW